MKLPQWVGTLHCWKMLRYAMTNRCPRVGDGGKEGRLSEEMAAISAQVRAWARMGIEYVQIREPELTPGEMLEVRGAGGRGRNEGEETEVDAGPGVGRRTRLLVPRWAVVAIEGGADGVHLPGSYVREEDFESRVRGLRERFRLAGVEGATVSVSCHAVEEVRRAARAGVDLALYGPVFEKVVGGARLWDGVGLEDLRRACDAAGTMTIFALGGVSAERVEACRLAGASGVAGIRMFAGERSAT